MEKRTKYIYIFGYKFTITSVRNTELNFWLVTVSLGKLSESYHDHTEDRASAEEASFGYFLINYCQGGIYWKKPPAEDKERLLAEQIG